MSRFGGNLLFERAVAALGFDDALMRTILRGILEKLGSSPTTVTPEELSMLTGIVERRLLLLAPYERVAPGLARLRRLLLCWDVMP